MHSHMNLKISRTLGITFLRANKKWICSLRSSEHISFELTNWCRLKLRRSLHMQITRSRILRKWILVSPRRGTDRTKQKFPCNKPKQLCHRATECPCWEMELIEKFGKWKWLLARLHESPVRSKVWYNSRNKVLLSVLDAYYREIRIW